VDALNWKSGKTGFFGRLESPSKIGLKLNLTFDAASCSTFQQLQKTYLLRSYTHMKTVKQLKFNVNK